MPAGRCANLRCPGLCWRTSRPTGSNLVELRLFVERGQPRGDFVGALYAKEIHMVDGQECQGVSVSLVASSASRKDVVRQIAELAKQRAEHYSGRGYKVVMAKLLAA